MQSSITSVALDYACTFSIIISISITFFHSGLFGNNFIPSLQRYTPFDITSSNSVTGGKSSEMMLSIHLINNNNNNNNDDDN